MEKKNYLSINYGGLKLWITILAQIFVFNQMSGQSTFLEKQMAFERVQDAVMEKEYFLKDAFQAKSLTWPPEAIYIRSFKSELELEVWVYQDGQFQLFKNYAVCAGSGMLGPKNMQGDKQVPEGFYFIDRFNPVSNFWLSLGIDYPNQADAIRSDAEDLGGDIFIHGSCSTIGCLPMTDDWIKEIYVLAVHARNEGQEKIPVHIFPYRFTMLNNAIFSKHDKHKEFWDILEKSYQYFNENKLLQNYYISKTGEYILLD